MDEFIDELLREDRACDVILPRIQVRLSHSHYSRDCNCSLRQKLWDASLFRQRIVVVFTSPSPIPNAMLISTHPTMRRSFRKAAWKVEQGLLNANGFVPGHYFVKCHKDFCLTL